MKKDLLAATKQMCLQQLKNSYQNGDLTDMELVCDTQVFKCHQLILSIRSQVFRAMFQNPMAEATTKKVEIKDLSPEIVEAMLLYIYTGDVPNLDELAVELLAAAEKYALEDLKSLCEQQLTSGLDIENAVDLFLLADMYLAASLRKNAVQLLARNLNVVLTNAVWKQKMEGQPILLSEIMLESLAMNNKEIKGKN
jgi:speckle-type POZ protein